MTRQRLLAIATACAGFAVVATGIAYATSSSQVGLATGRPMITAAESEGERWPTADSTFREQAFEPGAKGEATHRCASPYAVRNLIVGDFLVVPFLHTESFDTTRWLEKDNNRIVWRPRYVKMNAPSAGGRIREPAQLDVTVTRLDRHETPMHYSYDAWVGPPIWALYSDFKLPDDKGGEWMIVATAGPNWGCMLYPR